MGAGLAALGGLLQKASYGISPPTFFCFVRFGFLSVQLGNKLVVECLPRVSGPRFLDLHSGFPPKQAGPEPDIRHLQQPVGGILSY